jgi:hypothetical protein
MTKIVITPFELKGCAEIKELDHTETYDWGTDKPTIDSVMTLLKNVNYPFSQARHPSHFANIQISVSPTQLPIKIRPNVHKDGRICANIQTKTFCFTFDYGTQLMRFHSEYNPILKMYHIPKENIEIV